MMRVLLLLLLALSACSFNQKTKKSGYPSRGRPALPEGWTRQASLHGVEIDTPPGWRVGVDSKDGHLDITGDHSEKAAIWPVFIEGDFSDSAALAAAGGLLKKLRPGEAWSAPTKENKGTAIAKMTNRNSEGRALFWWTSTKVGSAAVLFVATAPAGGLAERAGLFGQIFKSFRMTGNDDATERTGKLSFVTWVDPVEHAFTMKVPQGWTVEGGLIRTSVIDPKAIWVITSPEKDIRLTSGDKAIPLFTEPNEILDATGFPEGSWYSPGFDQRWFVRRFISGFDYSKEYVAETVSRDCPDVSFGDSRERNDIDQAINAIYARYPTGGAALSLSSGETTYSCGATDARRDGYLFASTLHLRSDRSGLWLVQNLFGSQAPTGQGAFAQGLLYRVVMSTRADPDWVARQQNATAEASRIIAETHDAATKAITEAYEARNASMDELSRRGSNAMLETMDVVDPVTGTEFKIKSSSNYYWVDGQERIVGTETYTTPGIDFTPLIQRP